MSDPGAQYDPRNLIREAYRIEGITLADCRTIFLDWALGREAQDPRRAIEALIEHYAAPAEHPMTVVLNEALASPPSARRRGGARGRRG